MGIGCLWSRRVILGVILVLLSSWVVYRSLCKAFGRVLRYHIEHEQARNHSVGTEGHKTLSQHEPLLLMMSTTATQPEAKSNEWFPAISSLGDNADLHGSQIPHSDTLSQDSSMRRRSTLQANNSGAFLANVWSGHNSVLQGSRTNGNSLVRQINRKLIPFYVYPENLFPISTRCNKKYESSHKHGHALFAMKAIHNHTWRVLDPHLAQIAILPILPDLIALGKCDSTATVLVLKHEIRNATKQIGIYPTTRHIFIANHWITKSIARELHASVLRDAIWVGMEGPETNCYTSLGYTSNLADFWYNQRIQFKPNSTRPASQRIYSVNMVGQVSTKAAYADRLALLRSKGRLPSPFIVASSDGPPMYRARLRRCRNTTMDYDRCVVEPRLQRRMTQEALELSNYTLCLRGDTLGSDRWINAMSAGTALVAVVKTERDLDWLPFPRSIPWKDFVLRIKQQEFRLDPALAIMKLLNATSDSRLQKLQDTSRYYFSELDWSVDSAKVVMNLLRECMAVRCNPGKT